MKYLIFGRRGWLANKFNKALKDSLVSPVDINDLTALKKELDRRKPEIVINAAGVTGRPNIDWCESHKLETLMGNTMGPLNILQTTQKKNIYFVHLSSGCIFQGNGPGGQGFKEEDQATPPSFYSWTKYWADQILKNFPVLILRLRLPIDEWPNPRNLIDKLKNYENIIDAENSVTVVPDLIETAEKLIKRKVTGVYHVTNPGTIKHREFMELYKRIIDTNHRYKLISIEDLYSKGLAKSGRSNCFLNTEKLQKEGINLKPIKERLPEIMEEYRKNL